MSNDEDRAATESASLPTGWKVATLGEVTAISKKPGSTGSRANLIPFIPMSLLPQNGLYAAKYEMRQPHEVRSGVPIREGDLLLAKITPCLENGKQGIVRGLPGGRGYASTEVFPLQALPAVLPEFLALYLRLRSVRHGLAEKMQGATGRQRLPKDALEALVVPVPPMCEQRAIAHVLSTVQRAREATEAVIAAARELKRSLMRHLFTYGPVPPAEAERVALKETEIGAVPEHWDVRSLADVMSIASGQVDPRIPPYLEMVHIGPEDVEEATGRILTPRTAKELRLRSGKYLFTPDDVVYSKIRPYLRKVALPDFMGLCSADMYALRPKDELRDRRYLYFALLSDVFTQQAVSHQQRTGIPKINRTQLNSVFIPLPSELEQTRIADMLMTLDRKVEVEEKRRAALEQLFRSLLQQLMTGQVRLDPIAILKEVE